MGIVSNQWETPGIRGEGFMRKLLIGCILAMAAMSTPAMANQLQTPLVKVMATRNYGGHVVLHGANYDDAYAEAIRLANKDCVGNRD